MANLFISYHGTGKGISGFGNAVYGCRSLPPSIEDLKEAEKMIIDLNDLDSAVILSIQPLADLHEEET